MRVLSNEDLRWVSGGFETNCQFHQSDVEYAQSIVNDLRHEADDLFDLWDIAWSVYMNDTYGSPTYAAHDAAQDSAWHAYLSKMGEVDQAEATLSYVEHNACED